MLNVSIYLLLGILVLTCILMVLIVLMQRPKNEGLGASFGGGMTQDLFGAQTTNVLQKFTVYLGAVFFLSSLVLTILYSKMSVQTSGVQKTLQSAAAKAKAKPAPAATTPQAALPVAAATPPLVSTPPVEAPAPALSPAPLPAASATPAPAPVETAPATIPDVVVPTPAAAATP